MSGITSVALVTGASSGIGLAFSRLLAGDGYNLYLVARSSERLREIADDLRAKHNVEVYLSAVDLTSDDAGDRLVKFVDENELRVDLLINNAGVGMLGPFQQTSLEDHLNLARLNVVALVELTHRFLTPMVVLGRGGVINVASMAGFTPGPLMTDYYASKAFVVSFSQGLARELKDTGVTVTALCPGPTPTKFQERAGFPQAATALPSVSAERVAEAGLMGFRAGKTIVVPGFLNKILAVLSRILPERLTSEVVHGVQTKRMKASEQ